MIGVAIDPGLRGCGVAVFNLEEKRLIRAEYVKNPCTSGNSATEARELRRAIDAMLSNPCAGLHSRLWYEIPRSYVAGSQKGSQNDLIDLAGFMFAIACSPVFEGAALTRYFPRDWKGTLNADQMIERIEKRLSPAETAAVKDAGYLAHNVIDAVGIGLKALGRLEPKRVFDFQPLAKG